MKQIAPFLGLILLLSCSADEAPHRPDSVFQSPKDLKKEEVVSGLHQAWGMAFLDASKALVTQKEGQVVLVNADNGNKQILFTVPNATAYGQGGLLGITLSPSFASDNLVYVTYTKQGAQGYTTAVGRFTYVNDAISNFQEVYVADAWGGSSIHFGSRVIYDNQGYLYFSVGDRGQMMEAQNTNNDKGSVLRLNPDGSIPSDNPYVTNSDFSPAIFSFGNRNIQGLVFDTQTNEIWSHEHGPQGGDEINIITAGSNYGWPLATFGEQYGGGQISQDTALEGAEAPIHYWTPSIAPSGMAIITGNTYPGWEGNVIFGALAGQHVNRTVFRNGGFQNEYRYFEGQGRIRDVVLSPDGFIYCINESQSAIFKLIPVVE